jgi:hypothetical protein
MNIFTGKLRLLRRAIGTTPSRTYAHEIDAYSVQAHEVYCIVPSALVRCMAVGPTQKRGHACEMHVSGVHTHDMHACEVHAP